MDIRNKFLDYFKKNGHLVLPSSSLIPHNDASVLLTTAGMQQFKPYFLGIKKPPAENIATVQKCFRTSDIDSVGYTDKHLTFFEMLGNFSFGDYFKKKAIKYSLDFLLNELGLPIEKLKIAVFKGSNDIPADLESIRYWKESGIDDNGIYRYGKEDNFWGPAGDTGPCGPCSEIYFDFGEEYGCGNKNCGPNCECSRFMEVWNLVFTQYDFDGRKYNELPRKNIDTGMGLERITSVLEGNPSVFKTPLFSEIIKNINKLSDSKKHLKGEGAEFEKGSRIIADHIRAVYFLISDGVVPSNEGRGYILRRIIRRCIRFGKLNGIKDYFLNDIGQIVIEQYSKWYPELLEKKDFSFKLVSDEEKRFTKTLKEGSRVLIQKVAEIKKNGKEFINPKDAFKLYDTFGFPVELTREILNENKIKLNLEKFNEYLRKHTEKSKRKEISGRKTGKNLDMYSDISKNLEVEFSGYTGSREDTVIEALIKIDRNGNKKATSELAGGEKGEIILKKTPFYGEKGGQTGDRGTIKKGSNIFIVNNCSIPVEGIYVHEGTLAEGELRTGDKVTAEVDYNFRKNISRNHTATHILHWVLRSMYGSEIKQAGSFVGEDKFRFDYSIYNVPSDEDIKKIEKIINEKIQNNDPVRCFETTREFAEEVGTIALFDEKYGKFVRVVEIDNYSRELCGGIHVWRTGEIGLFKIISESGIGSNLRRIEAVTGMHAYKYLIEKEDILKKVSGILDVEYEKIPDSLKDLKDILNKKEEELKMLRAESVKKEIINKSGYTPEDRGLKIVTYNFSKSRAYSAVEADEMGIIGDRIIDYFRGINTFVILGNIINDKSVLILDSTEDLVEKGINCGKLAGETGKKLKGGGGGKPHYAQMGFSDKNIDKAVELVKNKILDAMEKKNKQ